MELYERMVEFIETGVQFSIQSLSTQFRSDGFGYNIARNVVYDMAKHELITCLKDDRRGEKCLRWVRRANL